MEPIIFVYIGAMTVFGLFAVNLLSENTNNIIKNKFKHYRLH